jgi:hypothetical protein
MAFGFGLKLSETAHNANIQVTPVYRIYDPYLLVIPTSGITRTCVHHHYLVV